MKSALICIFISMACLACDDDNSNNNNKSAQCGNGIIELGETCDGSTIETSCSEHGKWAGKPTCTAKCEIDYSTCESVVDIRIGWRTGCAVTDRGRVYCWGQGIDGEIGNGEFDNQQRAVPISAGGSVHFMGISAGFRNVTALSDEGEVWKWGFQYYGEGYQASSAVPTLFLQEQTFVQISSGNNHSCGLTALGDVYCWGKNEYGQLGDGSIDDSYQPVFVDFGKDVEIVHLALMGVTSCALDSYGN
ncbi:hypothetical protein KJ865_17300, partial [Myxococcota bacterium]|nr:hypothetical protein [Myxococcota bacterium]